MAEFNKNDYGGRNPLERSAPFSPGCVHFEPDDGTAAVDERWAIDDAAEQEHHMTEAQKA
jgi:hypothetical protein